MYDTQLPEFYERASFAPKGQDPSMIEAENVAQYYHITRKQQDAFAIRSHHLTHQYYKNGSISNEIVSLNIKGHLFDKDESIKPTLTEQRLNRLRPLLANGTVTVGNSCMKMTARACTRYESRNGITIRNIRGNDVYRCSDNRCQSETTRYWTSTS